MLLCFGEPENISERKEREKKKREQKLIMEQLTIDNGQWTIDFSAFGNSWQIIIY